MSIAEMDCFCYNYLMISREEVIRIANLARLELTEKEIGKMQKDLSSILDYFDLLKKVPKLAKSERASRTRSGGITTRKDEVLEKPASLANNLIAAAPDKKDNYIKVKAVL